MEINYLKTIIQYCFKIVIPICIFYKLNIFLVSKYFVKFILIAEQNFDLFNFLKFIFLISLFKCHY